MKTIEEELDAVIQRIKAVRNNLAVSQLELAMMADLSQSFIACLETGKKQPSVLTILKIARALNVPAQQFFNAEIANNTVNKNEIPENAALLRKKRRIKGKIVKLLDTL
jgi:transcriptional regulator with XRE-family HTH domain